MATSYTEWFSLNAFKDLDVKVQLVGNSVILTAMSVYDPILIKQIKDEDPNLAKIRDHISNKPNFQLVDEILYFKNQLCVPKIHQMTNPIMTEAHTAKYAMHPGSIKMYRNLKSKFWWNNMKRDIVEFVSKCYTYLMVKFEHRKPPDLLHPLYIPEWK